MIRKWLGIVVILITAVVLLNLSSCARSQKLQAITISPSGFTYGSAATPGIQQTPIPLTAYGSFIHPPETKDITNNVTWASDVTPVANVDSSGHLTAGTSCGGANISATYYTDSGNPSGNVVVGSMLVTVDGPASLGCTPAGIPPTLSVQVTANTATSGTVTSSPPGISCTIGSTCNLEFPAGTAITLTAVPATSFKNWTSGCSQTNANICTVFLQSDASVVAAFN